MVQFCSSFSCKPAFCIEVSQPAGGAVTLSTDGTKTSARYACDSGYTLSGSVTITCNNNGLWNSEFSTCGMLHILYCYAYLRPN